MGKQRPISFDSAASVGNRAAPPTPLDKMLFSQASNLAERLYSDSPGVARANSGLAPQKGIKGSQPWATSSAPQTPAAFMTTALPKRYSENAATKVGAPTHPGISQFQYTSTTPQMSPDMARNQVYSPQMANGPGVTATQGVVKGPPPVPVAPARHVRRPSGGK